MNHPNGILSARPHRRSTRPPVTRKICEGAIKQVAATPSVRIARILVPIDFSHESIKALTYASALSTALGSRIVLLHVTPLIKLCVDCGYGPVPREGPDELQTERDRDRLRGFARRHIPREFLEDILIQSGSAAREIIRVAGERAVDLIILQSHANAKPETPGSHDTARRVCELARCPVLIVPSR